MSPAFCVLTSHPSVPSHGLQPSPSISLLALIWVLPFLCPPQRVQGWSLTAASASEPGDSQELPSAAFCRKGNLPGQRCALQALCAPLVALSAPSAVPDVQQRAGGARIGSTPKMF